MNKMLTGKSIPVHHKRPVVNMHHRTNPMPIATTAVSCIIYTACTFVRKVIDYIKKILGIGLQLIQMSFYVFCVLSIGRNLCRNV